MREGAVAHALSKSRTATARTCMRPILRIFPWLARYHSVAFEKEGHVTMSAPPMLKRPILVLLCCLAAANAAMAANWPEHPTLRAVRVSAGPAIDGDLSDPAWQSAPEFTDFTQHDPTDRAPPTMKPSTSV